MIPAIISHKESHYPFADLLKTKLVFKLVVICSAVRQWCILVQVEVPEGHCYLRARDVGVL
jgi:hypothetical protein